MVFGISTGGYDFLYAAQGVKEAFTAWCIEFEPDESCWENDGDEITIMVPKRDNVIRVGFQDKEDAEKQLGEGLTLEEGVKAWSWFVVGTISAWDEATENDQPCSISWPGEFC